MKKILYITFLILLGNLGFSQTVTIGTGTELGNHPIYPFFGYTYSQSIYYQSEIGVSGDITAIRFYYTGAANTDNITVYIGHTTKTTFTSTTDWVPVTSMTQVYTGNYSYGSTTGWYEITLTTPFTYNNTDNLVIAVDENTSGYHSSSDDFYNTIVTGNRSIYYYSDATNPDPASPPTADAITTKIANVQLVFTSSAPMVYSSCTTTQNNTSNVSLNTTNNEVIGIEVVTTGSLNPIDATSFTFNTTGTTDPTNDIINATLWSTGTSSTFATTTQVGSVVANPNGTFTINGTTTLSSGTNYFWLTYDVTSGATLGDVIDAECTSITVGGTAYTPTTTAPAGNRKIDYCTFSNTASTTYYIDNFSTTGGSTNITNTASGFSTNGYGDFTSLVVTQEQGATFDFSVSFGSTSTYTFGFSIWIDWNQDGDFSDAGENVYLSSSYETTFSGTITVPTSATTGNTRMRIVADYSDSTPTDPCSGADEVEDYTVNVLVGTPMSVSSITTTQNNTTDTYKGLSNVEVIGIVISTTGTLSPISVSSFTLNTNGTTNATNDIQNATLWTTGTSSTFATTTQIGSIVSAPNGTFTINSGSNLPYTLSTGNNYFWLTYDIPITATANNFIDAECTSATVDGSAYTPTTTAPAGNRKIIAPPTFDGTFSSGNIFSANGMTVVNDATNQWYVGSATGNPVDAAYISNDGGTSNAYDNATTTYSHFYFDYLFPAGQTIITLTFDWKCEGEGSTSDYDNLKVFIEPTTETPVAGTANNATYQVGSSWYNLLSTGWNTETITLSSAYAGTIKRVVFQWKNDGSVGTDPPAAVDNIVISTHVPTAPDCAINLSPADGATDVCNATVSLSWDAATTGDPAEGYYLYFGTDNPPTNIENGTNIGNVTSYDPGTLTENTTYYWQIVPYNSGGSASGCSIYSFTTGDGQANDLPCNAETIALGSTASGDNECSSDDNEPAVPSCWTTGTVNAVWYSFVAPASGAVEIATVLGTIDGTQIAVYSGTCSNLTYVDCNQDAPSCGSSYDNSSFTVIGLTSGDNYFVRVDGESDSTGTFNISIADTTTGIPPIYGQDCALDNSIPVCNSTFTVGDPGFQAIGNTCDFDGSQDCTGGERGAVWYHIAIDSPGSLSFTLIPNDYDPLGSTGNETDYDFLLYRIASGSVDSSIVDCSCINDNTCGPIRCDFSYLGITGMFSAVNGSAPAPYSPDYDNAFVAELNVLAGDEFYLVIQNYSNSTSGFSIDFGTTPIGYPGGVPTSLTWTGGANSTDWYEPLNWGDCAYYPNENIDANIIASSTFQPVIDAIDPNNGNNARAKSLTISSGANLTIAAGQTLEVYGDYTNTGIFNANTGSTVLFTGTSIQTIDGSLQGSSAFDNLTITKTGGTVTTNQNIEAKGSFLTSNNTSIFNLNDKMFSLGGNFNNFNANTTFTGTTSSTFIFNGNALQTYSPNGILALHDVTINNTGEGVSLSNNLIINNTGSLTLTNGIIATNTNMVQVLNTTAQTVSTGNTNSYINGVLRRYITSNIDTYNLPVGDNTRYTLSQVINNSLSTTSYIDVKFENTFTNTGVLDPSLAYDLGTPYASVATEGVWQIDPDVQPSSGSYSILVWFNDGGGANSFTGLIDNQFAPLKRSSSSTLAADWTGELIGSINATGTVGRTVASGYAQRNGITSFSQFALGLSDVPLPISLISFYTICLNNTTKIMWTTASEENNDYFTLEKSYDGTNFTIVDIINGQGNSNEFVNYEYYDSEPKQCYYRLKQTDFDANYSYTGLIASSCIETINDDNIFDVNYNGEGSITITINERTDTDYYVSIVDCLGREIKQIEIKNNSNTNIINIPTLYLEHGLYNIVIRFKNKLLTYKIII